MKKIICLFVLFVSLSKINAQKADVTLKNTFHIESSGGWDYLISNPSSNKLYVSHGIQVNILDKITGDSLGVIKNTQGVHGIAFINNLQRGYTSNGRSNDVTVFDLNTNEPITNIPTGENPDAIFYEAYSKHIITLMAEVKI